MQRTFCTIICNGHITMLLYLSKRPKHNPQQGKIYPDCDIPMHQSIFLICVLLNDWQTNELTNTTEESPSWNSYSCSPEFPLLLPDPTFWHHCHNNPPFVSALSNISHVHKIPTDLFKLDLKIILLSKPKSCKWSLPS
jgi:hypothetical protein